MIRTKLKRLKIDDVVNDNTESFMIPRFLFESKINSSSKIIYCFILESGKNNTYLTIQDISNLINSNVNTATKYINELIEQNLIRELNDTEKYKILSKKNLDNLGIGINVCEWCHIKTTYLHKHHYPIKKSNGGIDTVNICPICHSEFHNRLFVIKE